MSAHSSLRQQIRAFLVKEGYAVTAGREAGDADILACAAGRWLSLEIKTGKGRPTKYQAMKIRRIRGAGGYGWVVRSVAQAVRAVELVKQGVIVTQDDELGIDMLIDPPAQPNEPDDYPGGIVGPDVLASIPTPTSPGILETLLLELRRNTAALQDFTATVSALSQGLAAPTVIPVEQISTSHLPSDDEVTVTAAPAAVRPEALEDEQPKKRRGRPPGSKNRPVENPPVEAALGDIFEATGDAPTTVDDLDLSSLPGLTADNPPVATTPPSTVDDLGEFSDLVEGF